MKLFYLKNISLVGYFKSYKYTLQIFLFCFRETETGLVYILFGKGLFLLPPQSVEDVFSPLCFPIISLAVLISSFTVCSSKSDIKISLSIFSGRIIFLYF